MLSNQLGYLMITLLFTLSCNTTQGVSSNKSETATYTPTNSSITTEDIVGTWDIQLQTRRGNKTSVLTISEENGQLKGKTERANFDIERDGNLLTWNSQIDSPMGAIDATHEVLVNGKTLEGTVKARGRTVPLTGTKRSS